MLINGFEGQTAGNGSQLPESAFVEGEWTELDIELSFVIGDGDCSCEPLARDSADDDWAEIDIERSFV